MFPASRWAQAKNRMTGSAAKTKRILFLEPQPFFAVRGSPFRVRATVSALTELGYCVDLVVLPLGENITIPGVEILRVPKIPGIRCVPTGPSLAKFFYDSVLFFYALKLLLRRRYTAVHGVEEAGIIAAIIGRLFALPYIFDMHSCMPEQLANLDLPCARLFARFVALVEKHCIRRAAAVMTVGEEHALYARGIAPLVHAVSVPDAALDDTGKASAADVERLRRELNIQDKRVAVYTGNFDPCQGIPLLLRGFAAMFERKEAFAHRDNCVLLIVGGAPEEEERRKVQLELAQTLNIADAVVFTGTRPAAEMPAFMALADVLVSARISGANTPLKIYSYMAAERIIAATRISSHTQVLSDATALLCEPEPKALGQVLAAAFDPAPSALQKRRSMIIAAKRLVELRFSRSSFKTQLSALYSAVEQPRCASRNTSQPRAVRYRG